MTGELKFILERNRLLLINRLGFGFKALFLILWSTVFESLFGKGGAASLGRKLFKLVNFFDKGLKSFPILLKA